MQEGLNTGPRARRPGSGLSGPIFSGPHDCADLVNSSQDIEFAEVNLLPVEHFDFRDILQEGTEIERAGRLTAAQHTNLTRRSELGAHCRVDPYSDAL